MFKSFLRCLPRRLPLRPLLRKEGAAQVHTQQPAELQVHPVLPSCVQIGPVPTFCYKGYTSDLAWSCQEVAEQHQKYRPELDHGSSRVTALSHRSSLPVSRSTQRLLCGLWDRTAFPFSHFTDLSAPCSATLGLGFGSGSLERRSLSRGLLPHLPPTAKPAWTGKEPLF